MERPGGWVGLGESTLDSRTEWRGTRTISTKGHYERLSSSVQALGGTQRPSNQTITQGPFEPPNVLSAAQHTNWIRLGYAAVTSSPKPHWSFLSDSVFAVVHWLGALPHHHVCLLKRTWGDHTSYCLGPGQRETDCDKAPNHS